jgi:phosphoenolpyruvate phosphomutase
LSAQFGVRDNNEASWTQVLEMVEFMSEATSIPILLDGDTGYGNFNSFRRLIRKLEKIEVGGVCIEDKLFPKTNSFISGEKQELADPYEFAGKIKAGKDTQLHEDFCIVARTEAFIAGWGLKEAIKRSEIYMEAGADAILIHSSKSHANEILAFCKEWDKRLPVIIVPTKYYKTSTKVFEESKINLVIWANHLLRSSIKSMQLSASQLMLEKTLINLEEQVAPLNEIFRLQNTSELEIAETSYLPQKQELNVIVLSAGETPQNDLKIRTLDQIGETLKSCGIVSATCVLDQESKYDSSFFRVKYTDKEKIQSEVFSLLTGMDDTTFRPDTGILVQYGDVLIPSNVMNEFLNLHSEALKIIGVTYKHSLLPKKEYYDVIDLDESKFDSKIYYLSSIRTTNNPSAIDDLHWIGVIYIPPHLIQTIKNHCEELLSISEIKKPTIVDLMQIMNREGFQILVELKFGKWIDNEISSGVHIL